MSTPRKPPKPPDTPPELDEIARRVLGYRPDKDREGPAILAITDTPEGLKPSPRGRRRKQILHVPQPVGRAGLHGRRHAQRLVHAAEVVEHVVQGHGAGVLVTRSQVAFSGRLASVLLAGA